MDENELKEHIDKAMAGEQASLAALFEGYKDAVYYFLTHYIDNNNDIEDVIQETFISAFNSLHSLDNPVKFKNWLFTIAYRRAMDFYRSKKLPNELKAVENITALDNIEEDNAEFIPSEMLELEETRKYIVSLVKKLPETQRTAVLLYYYQQMSIPEIAEALGCSEGTIKSRLNYARKFIKADIEQKEKKGHKILVVVPLPLLTQILLYEAKLSPHISENTWKTIEANISITPVRVNTSTKETTSSQGITLSGVTVPVKLVIAVLGIVALVVVAILINQPDEKNEPLSTNEVQQDSMQNAERTDLETTVQDEGAEIDFSDEGTIELETKSDYAKMYYDMLQKVFMHQTGFLDAEIALTTNGAYSLEMLYKIDGRYESYYVTVEADTYDFTYANFPSKSFGGIAGTNDDPFPALGQIMIVDYFGHVGIAYLSDDKLYLELIWRSSLSNNGFVNDFNVGYKLIESNYYGGDVITGEAREFIAGDYAYNGSSGIKDGFEFAGVINLEELEAACISTWGVGHGENDFTGGERLKKYFE